MPCLILDEIPPAAFRGSEKIPDIVLEIIEKTVDVGGFPFDRMNLTVLGQTHDNVASISAPFCQAHTKTVKFIISSLVPADLNPFVIGGSETWG